MMTVDDVQTLLKKALPAAFVNVQSPDGVHFSALVVSDSFQGQNRVAQHRAVYAALGNAFDGPLHALQLNTMTFEEAAKNGIEIYQDPSA